MSHKSKNIELVGLAKKQGNDADLFLLDLIHRVEDIKREEIDENKIVDGLLSRIESKLVEGAVEKLSQAVLFTSFRDIKGEEGKRGAIGDKGDRGDRGNEGEQGKKGEQGDQGDKGNAIKGDTGEPGIPADENNIVSKITKDLPQLGEPIRDGLELLEEDDRLDSSAIKGLDERFKKAEKSTRTFITGRRGDQLHIINFSGDLDGSKKSFFIGSHFGIKAILSSSSPFGAWIKDTDYTETGQNLVFTDVVNAATYLAAGQQLVVLYAK